MFSIACGVVDVMTLVDGGFVVGIQTFFSPKSSLVSFIEWAYWCVSH